MTTRTFASLFFVALLAPALASAHQPRIVDTSPTVVVEPEVSKAFYDQLTGAPHVYTLHATSTFALYVNVLVPDRAGQKKDVSAAIMKDGKQIAVLEGINYEWKQMYEPFGADSYYQGPEYKAEAAPGDYEIVVWSSNNDSAYSLAVGETEAFTLAETLNTLVVVPQLKSSFFKESPATFLYSPIGAGYVVTMFVLAFLFGFLYRFVLRLLARRGSARAVGKNISSRDRWFRAAIGLMLFAWAVVTTWSALILFLAGFCFFEAIFSWCGLYAALGRNSCPV